MQTLFVQELEQCTNDWTVELVGFFQFMWAVRKKNKEKVIKLKAFASKPARNCEKAATLILEFPNLGCCSNFYVFSFTGYQGKVKMNKWVSWRDGCPIIGKTQEPY